MIKGRDGNFYVFLTARGFDDGGAFGSEYILRPSEVNNEKVTKAHRDKAYTELGELIARECGYGEL